ncbi:MAG: hypothetical protein JWQ68_448 [Cryobacterium sp.]|jgi:hypothetical protein|nr:hypothetical protein [Cryobacterium sp.]
MAGKRGVGGLVAASVVLLALVGAYFIADSLLRGYAERRVKQEITSNLPDNVTGDPAVSLGGISVIAQYLSGRFERVEVRAPELRVDEAVVSVHLVATDVPVDTSRPVGSIRGTVDLGEDSVNALLTAAAVPGKPVLTLGNGEVTYIGSIAALGFPIEYRATAVPEAQGGSVVFRPTGAEVVTGVGSLDLSGMLQRILGQQPISICVAEYLPLGVELTGVDVTPERARITLHAPALVLSPDALRTLGSCSG